MNGYCSIQDKINIHRVLFRFFGFMMASMLAIGFGGCGDDEPDPNVGNSSSSDPNAAETYAIAGTVRWLAETPLPNITMILKNMSKSGEEPKTTTTDADGHFTFSGLVTGDYAIEVESDMYEILYPDEPVLVTLDSRVKLVDISLGYKTNVINDHLILSSDTIHLSTIEHKGKLRISLLQSEGASVKGDIKWELNDVNSWSVDTITPRQGVLNKNKIYEEIDIAACDRASYKSRTQRRYNLKIKDNGNTYSKDVVVKYEYHDPLTVDLDLVRVSGTNYEYELNFEEGVDTQQFRFVSNLPFDQYVTFGHSAAINVSVKIGGTLYPWPFMLPAYSEAVVELSRDGATGKRSFEIFDFTGQQYWIKITAK